MKSNLSSLRVRRILIGMGSFGFKRPGVALVLAGLLSVLALIGARGLRLDTDLARLLPDSFASVQDLEALEARSGAVGYVTVVVQGGAVDQRRAHAQRLAAAIEALPEVRFVDVERPVDWFTDRAPYYLDVADLEVMATRVADRARWERRRNNPMIIDLEETAAPSVDMSDIQQRNAGNSATGWLRRQADRFYEAPGMLVLFARPALRATDMGFAEAVTQAVQGVVDAQADQAPALRVELTGRYPKQVDQKRRIQKDLGMASGLALGLALLYLMVHFRRLQAVVFVGVPLGLGLLWTFGVTGATFGALNILTGFIGAILLGLGVDHGIHLLSAWQTALRSGATPDAAIATTFGETGRAVVIAGLTTIAAFIGVSLSDFRAFHEFGLVAAAGIAFVVLAYALVLPALLRLIPSPQRQARETVAPILAWSVRRPARALLWGGVLTAALIAPIGALSFDYDFAALEDGDLPSFRLDAQVNRLLGYSQTPALVLTDTPEQQRAIAARLHAAPTGSTIDMAATLADLVPARQAEKQQIIERMGRELRRIKPKWITDPTLKDARATLLRTAQIAPFTQADLPVAVQRQFQSPAGEGYVLAFPAIALSDGARVPSFARELRAAADGAPVAGESMVLADILTLVQREGAPLLGLTAALVFVVLWVLLASVRRALAAMFAAGLTLAGTLGIAGAAGLSLNYLNLVMIPVIIGIAVDGAAHLFGRDDADPAHLTPVGLAVSGSVITTAFGFGALLVADHPGLASLGALALIGLAVNLLVTLLVLPPIAALLAPARKETACPSPSSSSPA